MNSSLSLASLQSDVVLSAYGTPARLVSGVLSYDTVRLPSHATNSGLAILNYGHELVTSIRSASDSSRHLLDLAILISLVQTLCTD